MSKFLSDDGTHGHLLGDSGYPQRVFMMTPFAQPEGPEVGYNNAHGITRVRVEHLFGMWKRKFPCVGGHMQLSPEK